MKLHWSPRSPFVRKVMIFLHEVDLVDGVRLERSRVAMTEPNAEVMKDNPLNKIPTLVLDDGSSLFDSRVICEYLDSLHKNERLFPANPKDRWPALRYQALGDGALDVLILWRNEISRTSPNAKLAEVFELKITRILEKLEAEVAAMNKLPFCIGHIAIGCALSYMDFRFEEFNWRKGFPRLTKWHEEFSSRPSAQATEPIDA